MLIGKEAPPFTCKAVINGEIKEISLADFADRMKVLFFYPQDFTFVCPTELHAFQDALPEFEKRNTVILGISTDSVYSHLAWLSQPKLEGGVKGITYPLLSDITKSIARMYEALDEAEGISFRSLFLIDKKNIIQSMQINNLSLGRNIHEVIRLIDAVEFVETHGEVCPANWSLGQEGMKPTHEGIEEYFKSKK